MKEGRDLVKEAVQDAKLLKEAALIAAKNQIVEEMAPAIKRLLEKEINVALGNKKEDTDRLRRGVEDKWPGESHTGFEESKDKGDQPMDKTNDKELDMEALASFFPQLSEEPDPDADQMADESRLAHGIPTLGEADDELDLAQKPEGELDMKEAKKKDDEKEDEKDDDEEVEISEDALREVYEAAALAEVQVKKGFSDMTKAGELDVVAKDSGKGLNPEKKGEHAWDDEVPPAKQDFSVKEAIARGMQENKQLRENLAKAVKLIKTLGEKLHEVNLFNSKVMHVNRILNRGQRLTKEQKQVVLESIDKARSMDEVKMVYEAIVNSFKASQSLSEGKARKPVANAQRVRTSGTPKHEVLSESVDRANGDRFSRLRMLAGLTR